LFFKAPERRSLDNKPLSLIPNEVYLDIFDQLHSTEELNASEYKNALSNLALVCKFFCAIALPRLFEKMTFCATSLGQGTIAFCRQLVNNQSMAPSLALYVKSCVFSEWLPQHALGSTWTRSFLQLCTHSLARLVNVEELTLSKIPVNRTFWDAICSLKNLRSLTVHGCDFEDETFTDSQATLNLTRIELHGCRLPLRITDFINSSQLRVLQTSDIAFAILLFCRSIDFVLEDLGVIFGHQQDNEVNIAALQVILARTPLVTTLSITVPPTNNSEPTFTLPLPPLPMLRKLECPWYMLNNLASGRSLKEISVPCVEVPSTLAEFVSEQGFQPSFECSMSDIESLRIPLQVYLEVSFADCKRLRSLCLECSPGVDPNEVRLTLHPRFHTTDVYLDH
jgi:hypothetical protein